MNKMLLPAAEILGMTSYLHTTVHDVCTHQSRIPADASTALASTYVYVYVCVFMYTEYEIPGRMPADASTALARALMVYECMYMYVYVYVCVFMYT